MKSDVIGNCFKHAGFVTNSTADIDVIETPDDVISYEVSSLCEKLNGDYGTVHDYIAVDNAMDRREETTSIDSIVKSFDQPAEEIDDDDEAPMSPVSCHSAIECIKTLRNFIAQQANGGEASREIESIEKFVHNAAIAKRKQSTITSFFKPTQSS